MLTASVVFDSSFRHLSIYNSIIPEPDLIGVPVFEFIPPEHAGLVRSSFERCLTTGLPVAYRIEANIADIGPKLFLVRLKRFAFNGHFFIHCFNVRLPGPVAALTESDTDFLRLVGRLEQKELARLLSITVPSVSRRESALKSRIGVTSRYELRWIGRELQAYRENQ